MNDDTTVEYASHHVNAASRDWSPDRQDTVRVESELYLLPRRAFRFRAAVFLSHVRR